MKTVQQDLVRLLIKEQKRLIGARRLAEIEAAKAIKRPLDSKLFNMDKWETPK